MTTHSFSSISKWVQCPKQYHETYILKKWRQPESEAMRRGSLIHKELEDYLNGARTKPPTLAPKDGLLDMLKAAGAKPELPLALDRDLNPTDFWDKSAWLRGKLDVVIEQSEPLLAVDYKTGKKRANDLQADVYHTLLAGNYPKAQRIQIIFDYLEKGRQAPYQPGGSAVGRVVGLMTRIEESKAFPPRPTPLCGWCPVQDCEYWGVRG